MISKQEYSKMVDEVSNNSNIISNCIKSFVGGGSICLIGQIFYTIFEYFGASKENAGAMVAISLIFLAILLTGIGYFDNIVKFFGAGASVPITGFANAMASPAIEFKKEGLVYGLSAKMFIIAGPVIVYGTISSMLIGTIHYIYKTLVVIL